MSNKKSKGGASPAAPAPPVPPKCNYKRFRWIEVKLYCDNPFHVDLFCYLRDIGQYQGCHILHDQDYKSDGSVDKPHWHVTLYSDTRQVTGVEVGEGRFLLKSWASSFGSYDAIVDSSGKPAAYLPPNWAVDYPIPIKSGKVKTFSVLTDAAGVNDPSQWLLYMTHSDYKSIIAGKHRYQDTDLVIWENSPTIQNYLANSLTVSRSQSYELFEYTDGVSTGRELVEKLYSAGRFDLVDYVRKNPQFVAKFLIPGR